MLSVQVLKSSQHIVSGRLVGRQKLWEGQRRRRRREGRGKRGREGEKEEEGGKRLKTGEEKEEEEEKDLAEATLLQEQEEVQEEARVEGGEGGASSEGVVLECELLVKWQGGEQVFRYT